MSCSNQIKSNICFILQVYFGPILHYIYVKKLTIACNTCVERILVYKVKPCISKKPHNRMTEQINKRKNKQKKI